MDSLFTGAGTVLNVVGVVVGALVGMVVGERLPERTRSVVTDCLGLVTLLMAATSAAAVGGSAFVAEVGSSAPVLIVLGALLLGGVAGSLLRIEERLGGLAGAVQRRLFGSRSGGTGDEAGVSARERFVEGWLTTTLLFCVGPLTVLGTLDDGLGLGIDKLAVKTILDTFAAMAFASSFGIGVLASAVSLAIVQGTLTVVGVLLGAVFPEAQIDALTATGGLLLVGIGLRLLRIRDIPVGDLLPALVVAPLLTWGVGALL